MPITLDEIVEETREMPADVVAELVDRIMVARHGGIESSVAAAWKTEVDQPRIFNIAMTAINISVAKWRPGLKTKML